MYLITICEYKLLTSPIYNHIVTICAGCNVTALMAQKHSYTD